MAAAEILGKRSSARGAAITLLCVQPVRCDRLISAEAVASTRGMVGQPAAGSGHSLQGKSSGAMRHYRLMADSGWLETAAAQLTKLVNHCAKMGAPLIPFAIPPLILARVFS